MPRSPQILFSILVSLLLAVFARGEQDGSLAEFQARRQKVLFSAGQRHLDYGLDLRKKGLAMQAAAQIVLAVEASEGENRNANYVLGLMRRYDDGFWKKKIEKPGAKKVEVYEKKARELRADDAEERLELGLWAWEESLEEEAFIEFEEMLRARDEPLELDATGAIRVGKRSIPPAAALRIQAEAITINDKLYVRDEFLELLPELKTVYEATSPELRVRATTSEADARSFHALAAQLLPRLAEDLGGASDRRLQVVLFGERKLYDTYLVAAELLAYRSGAGYADSARRVAIVCMEGTDEAMAQGIVLHELTHLAQYAASPAILPSWYSEGFAELYGGEGTFTWNGTDLTTGGAMARRRIESLQGEGKLVPLADLLEGEALNILSLDTEKGQRFYAQAWAFVTFLRSGAGEEIAARFEQWEQKCLGSAIGANVIQKNGRDRSASQKLFRETFAKDLDRLETEFAAWVQRL